MQNKKKLLDELIFFRYHKPYTIIFSVFLRMKDKLIKFGSQWIIFWGLIDVFTWLNKLGNTLMEPYCWITLWIICTGVTELSELTVGTSLTGKELILTHCMWILLSCVWISEDNWVNRRTYFFYYKIIFRMGQTINCLK